MLRVCNFPLWLATVTIYGSTGNGDIFSVAAVGDDREVQYGPPPSEAPLDRLGNRNTVHRHIDGQVYLPISIDDHVGHNRFGTYHYGSGTVYGVAVSYTSCREPYHVGSVATSLRRSPFTYSGVSAKMIGTASSVVFRLAVSSAISDNQKLTYKGRPVTVTLGPGESRMASVVLYKTSRFGPSELAINFNIRVQRIPQPEEFVRASGPIDSLFNRQLFFTWSEHSRAHGWAIANGIPNAVTQAVESIRLVSINSLAYLHDVAGLVNQYRSFKRDLKRAKKGNKKAIANLYLSWNFGIRLFVSDSQALIRAYRRSAKDKARNTFRARVKSTANYGSSSITVVSNATVYVQNMTDAELTFYQATRSVDLFPSAANLWDFIPFSFVVDWCIDVGGMLEKLDASLDILSYPILGAELSVKSTSRLTARSPLTTDADFILYRRWSESQRSLSRLPLSALPGVGEGLSLKHGLDSLMLLVQRFSR